LEQSVTGSQFVSMTDEQLRGLAPTGQQPWVQRLLAAHEVFSDIDDCGEAVLRTVAGWPWLVACAAQRGW
jgi:hypothetical protein